MSKFGDMPIFTYFGAFCEKLVFKKPTTGSFVGIACFCKLKRILVIVRFFWWAEVIDRGYLYALLTFSVMGLIVL